MKTNFQDVKEESKNISEKLFPRFDGDIDDYIFADEKYNPSEK